jgi:NAD(P)-dependent dehydrogenase (short-subunit alcohol dehydrogenase family)
MSDTKTVLVIGASRGLGLALAEEFCSRGWRVIATERAHSVGLAALAARYPQESQHRTSRHHGRGVRLGAAQQAQRLSRHSLRERRYLQGSGEDVPGCCRMRLYRSDADECIEPIGFGNSGNLAAALTSRKANRKDAVLL